MTATTIEAGDRPLLFPPGFVWGAATAAYQIEGAAREDGRGPSIWDTFARRPGAVAGGDTGDVACDHYHRHRDDIALMAELGLPAYRFSVSWPRVRPDGAGPVNPRGLAFYDRLVDELLEAGITPYATLYHWDLPQALEDRGGWTERDTALRFAEYAGVVHDLLADRVATWTTVNEPWVAAFLGYGSGVHAPGRTSARDAFRAAHHLLLAHGLATGVLREGGARQISLTLNLAPVPTPGAPGDAADAAADLVDALLNRQFLDPVLRGRYPGPVLEQVDRAAGLGHIAAGDLAVISEPIDLLGINYYNPTYVAASPGAPENPAFPGSRGIAFLPAEPPLTAMGWPIDPDGLTELLVRLDRDYPGVPLIVTENGAAFDDVPGPDGRVRDPFRIGYLDGHLRAAHAALAAGVDLRGYLVWSLLDNFEWAEGYGKRFGLVYVDYVDQRRLPKDSAHWFRDVIARNGLGGNTA
ncbi:broad-specificity cellobiase [Thermomonospora echinospora]|uniref:Beta-glucosidase n=1 Tax=Thermomonospora echinospora TaxID=1992 RepID=A0A1H6E4A6_9ACTN|nr:GH1 family beta-glucosidase [Thermomonospora echinospora]SEG92073.1 broad-specificity cellobiase [Thermomonospora echinospora]